MATEQVRRKSDTLRSVALVKYLQLSQIGPVTRLQSVIRPGQPLDSIQLRKIEAAFLKFCSAIALGCGHLPYHNTIIRPPAVTLNSVVYLELREHLRIKLDAGRVELLTGVARGLRYIHDLDIVHGHLEFGTVEADQDGAVRLSDFWRSSVLPPRVTGPTMDAHPSFACRASDSGFPSTPEVDISKANDMYAFGLLAWELFGGESPPGSTVGVIITADSTSTQLPQPDNPELSDEVWDMIEKCFEAEPSRRLTVAEVEAVLEADPVYVNWASPFEFL